MAQPEPKTISQRQLRVWHLAAGLLAIFVWCWILVIVLNAMDGPDDDFMGTNLDYLKYTEGTDREPVYQGRPLRSWIDQYYWHIETTNSRVAPVMKPVWATNRSEALAAVRQMGTNALPSLFEMIRYGDSRRVKWGEWAADVSARTPWLDWVPHFIRRRYFHPRGVDQIENDYGKLGLEMLGPVAKPALVRALTDPNPRVRETATNLLSKLQ